MAIDLIKDTGLALERQVFTWRDLVQAHGGSIVFADLGAPDAADAAEELADATSVDAVDRAGGRRG